jgi:hypothetical protein
MGDAKLRELQAMYEPYLNGLSQLLCIQLPNWGVGEEFAKQRHSVVWKRITSPPSEFPDAPLDDIGHLGS